MSVERFEDLRVWAAAKSLAAEVYKSFSDSKDYGFKDQILRASVSVSNNIAEGFERKGNKEFRRFLYISKGSCGEVRSMLILSEELGYLSPENTKKLINDSIAVSKQLSALISSLPE